MGACNRGGGSGDIVCGCSNPMFLSQMFFARFGIPGAMLATSPIQEAMFVNTHFQAMPCFPIVSWPNVRFPDLFSLQECIRYNGLLAVMEKSLKETVKALKGLVVMSPELEAVSSAMYDNQVSCIFCGFHVSCIYLTAKVYFAPK